MIKKLDKISIGNISTNQVIIDISGSIKELLENSLDAESTVIEISLEDYGKSSIMVKDNGFGIDLSQNHDFLTEKGITSKLTDFNSFSKVNTYGFRGNINQIIMLFKLDKIIKEKFISIAFILKTETYKFILLKVKL